jgi:ATP-dependent DNA ligase
MMFIQGFNLDNEGRSVFNELMFRRAYPTFYAFDLLYLNSRDLRQLPLVGRKEKLRAIIDKSKMPDVICGKYVEGRGVDLFREVCERNLEGVVAKRKAGTYAAVSGWLKIKNADYTQAERRHELFDFSEAKAAKRQQLPPIPKKPPFRAIPLKVTAKRRSRRSP